jgi:hypothetical protein
MQRDMQREDARKILTSALWLARERVTGELDEKKIKRERITDLTARMVIGADNRPTGEDLREVLAGQDEDVRAALAAWT